MHLTLFRVQDPDFCIRYISYLEAPPDIVHPGDHTGVVSRVVEQVPDEHVQGRQGQLGRVFPRPASLALAWTRACDLGPDLGVTRVTGEAGGGGGHLHRGHRGRGPGQRARGREGAGADISLDPQ